MANYMHGIYGYESPTETPVTNVASAGIQAIIGTAPVNLLDNPEAAVGKPILLSSLNNVKSDIGYSSYLDKFSIMQAVHATFEIFNTAPIVAINVLDPAKHTTAKTQNTESLINGQLKISDIGVLLSTIVLKSADGTTTYALGTDYTAAFQQDETVLISKAAGSSKLTDTSEVQLSYSILDPSKVTDDDIIAGIALVNRIFPIVGVVPEILLAPGYSQNADVAAALIAAAQQVSSVFKAMAVIDIDSTTNDTIDKAIAAKTTGKLASSSAILCYPKVITTAGKKIWMSAQQAALMQSTDSANESTPFVSPSNHDFKISAAVLNDANSTEMSFFLDEANKLNGEGIVTALNFTSWKSWGDNTAIYSYTAELSGTSFDKKDQFINIKRAFIWQNNGFIKRYFSKIDNPLNFKAIQTLITDENQYYNAFIAAGLVAGMGIVYNQSDNPIDQIMSGKIQFKQSITPYIPMEVIENIMQFDPTTLQTALAGGTQS